MNRMVTLPALCSLIAFGSFYVGRLGQTESGDSAVAASVKSVGDVEANKPGDSGTIGASAIDAERLVRAVGDQYQTNYRNWQLASHSIMSRASPSPSKFAPIQLDIVMAPKSSNAESRLAQATISIRRKHTTDVLPCVVDLATQEVFVFQTGEWKTGQQWLDSAIYAGSDLRIDWQKKAG